MKGRFNGSGTISPRRKQNILDWFRQATARAMEEGGYVPRDQWDTGGSLWQCLCGAPTWQQPCPFCNYYSMGNDIGYDLQECKRVKGSMTKGEFVRRVEKAGGLVALWVANKKKSVAYAVGSGQSRPQSSDNVAECRKFVGIVDRALAYAKEHGDRYTPEEIWDAVQESGQRDLFPPWQ